MSGDRDTIDYYQREAPRYVLDVGHGASRHLDGFLDRLAPGARVLELGCGGGGDSARMIERGFDVDATDGTAAMVEQANARFGVGARQMRFDELEAGADYDAVWAHASLLHVPSETLPGLLARIHHALRPGGWHYANFKLGNGDARDALGRFYNFPKAEWLLDTFRDAGFEVVDTAAYRSGGADKVMRDWLALTLRRAPGP